MIASRYKALGLALMAVLGLMAFSVAGAQAKTPGVFLLDGKVAAGGVLQVAFEPANKHALMSTVGKNNLPVEVECETVELKNQVLNEKEGKGSAVFSKCKVLTPEGCKVAEPITTEPLIALGLLHKPEGAKEEETYIILEPEKAGGAFATLKFSECILPEAVEIKGLAVFKDCELLILKELETHLLEEVPHGLKLAADEGLKFGEKEAQILGSTLWRDPPDAKGSHTWSVH